MSKTAVLAKVNLMLMKTKVGSKMRQYLSDLLDDINQLKADECQGCDGSGECSQCQGSGVCPDCNGSGEE